MSKIEVQDLFKKYLDDSITPDEFSQLYTLINREYNPEILEEILESSFSDPAYAAGSKDHDVKEVFASILEKIRQREATEHLLAPVIPFYRRRNRRIAVAAAALLVLCAGAYFWARQSSPTPGPAIVQTVAPRKNDVSPGHDGAILTLANGKEIVLGDAQNGDLAVQGTTRITKLNNGQLNYTSSTGKPAEILYNTLTTPRARKTSVVLADGTQVWLNAASSIKYPTAFSGKERLVEITGEAYFEIAKNAKMPFIVRRAGSNESIEVLGTHFNVNTYDDEDAMKTTLLEGSVKVKRGTDSRILQPGQQAVLSNSKESIEVVDEPNTDEVMAWKNGRFRLNNMDLKTIMRQLARWYDIDVIFEGKAPDIRIGGILHEDVYLSTVMSFLKENGVRYKMEGKKIIILE